MSSFVSGLELSNAFYAEAVAPLVGDIPHAAALLGWGSDVLGFDTSRSTDHGWGPRLQVFVDVEHVPLVRDVVDAGLPDECAVGRRASAGTRCPSRITSRSLHSRSGFETGSDSILPKEWACTTGCARPSSCCSRSQQGRCSATTVASLQQ